VEEREKKSTRVLQVMTLPLSAALALNSSRFEKMCIFIESRKIPPVTILEACGRAMAIILFLVSLLSAGLVRAQIAGIDSKTFDEPVKVQHGSSVFCR